eukprot:9314255-Heterocapsa_arctica.AAC.1
MSFCGLHQIGQIQEVAYREDAESPVSPRGDLPVERWWSRHPLEVEEFRSPSLGLRQFASLGGRDGSQRVVHLHVD